MPIGCVDLSDALMSCGGWLFMRDGQIIRKRPIAPAPWSTACRVEGATLDMAAWIFHGACLSNVRGLGPNVIPVVLRYRNDLN